MDYQATLKQFVPDNDFFIGIDSDGCVFDTMEVKQKEFFIPNALKYFDLFSISGVLRETWEFINLYSSYRGGNRYISLIKVFELLKTRNEIAYSYCDLPDLNSLKEWVGSETKLGNQTLRKYLEVNYDTDLEKVTVWSEAVNSDIDKWLHNIPPFPNAISSIKKFSQFADLIVVSQTPLEALDREWEEHDLKKYTKLIAGQEHGTKTEHLLLTAKDKYPDNSILMIGDAIGDLEAAKNNEVLFFPIIPGKEDVSWERLMKEGINKFMSGEFSGRYENRLIDEFKNLLPDKPSWKR
jgi:phosphoglycolate phosphatase-like HAD superfamily hydrolase